MGLVNKTLEKIGQRSKSKIKMQKTKEKGGYILKTFSLITKLFYMNIDKDNQITKKM